MQIILAKKTYGTRAREHARQVGTRARGHARHVGTQGTRARGHVGTQGTMARRARRARDLADSHGQFFGFHSFIFNLNFSKLLLF